MRALIAALAVATTGLTLSGPATADASTPTGHDVTYPVVVDGFGSHTSRTLDPVRITDQLLTTENRVT